MEYKHLKIKSIKKEPIISEGILSEDAVIEYKLEYANLHFEGKFIIEWCLIENLKQSDIKNMIGDMILESLITK